MNTDITFYKLRADLEDCSTPYHIKEVYRVHRRKTITDRYRSLFIMRIQVLISNTTDSGMIETYGELMDDIKDAVEALRAEEEAEMKREKRKTLLNSLDIPASEYLQITLPDDIGTCNNLLEDIQVELIRIVADKCTSTVDIAKKLGISDRSIRNKLHKIMNACKTD